MAQRKERRIPCLIHIPGQYPDGREIEPEKMESFLEVLDRHFGGSTPLGIVPGRWVSDDGRVEKEPMHRIEVAVKKKDLNRFESIARLIGKEMKQKVVYVVINYQAQVRFLFVDDEDEPSSQQGASR
jgi:hypothetical protein